MNLPVTTAVSRTVPVSAESVWRVLRTGRDIDRILPGLVRSCRLEGEGPGAKRLCGIDQGIIEETLLAIDDEARLFRYRIDQQPLMPLTDYTGSIHVVDLGPQGARVLWFASYQLTEAAAQEVVHRSLQQLLGAGIEGLVALSREVA